MIKTVRTEADPCNYHDYEIVKVKNNNNILIIIMEKLMMRFSQLECPSLHPTNLDEIIMCWC